MKVCEYLSVRRAFGLVRQSTPASGRVTFDELGIMCHLANVGKPLRTSEIAEHQGVLRPTMTHRAGHLSELGLIERRMGRTDRRSVCCSLTDAGVSEVRRIVTGVCRNITAGMPLCRCTPRRMSLIIDECARATVSSADMVLMALADTADNERPYGKRARLLPWPFAADGIHGRLFPREGRPRRSLRAGCARHRRRVPRGRGQAAREAG